MVGEEDISTKATLSQLDYGVKQLQPKNLKDDQLSKPSKDGVREPGRAKDRIAATQFSQATVKIVTPSSSHRVRSKNPSSTRQFGRALKPGQVENPLIRGRIPHYEDLERQRRR